MSQERHCKPLLRIPVYNISKIFWQILKKHFPGLNQTQVGPICCNEKFENLILASPMIMEF